MTERPPVTYVLCLDGTWNELDSRTNVLRFFEQLARDERQVTYYDEGVGTPGTTRGVVARLRERVRGGLFGAGLLANALEAYRWLAERHRPGDKVAIVGFSRGAYTARVLAALLGKPGLLRAPGGEIPGELLKAIGLARQEGRAPQLPAGFRLETVDVDFLGVWDTVGRLGVPRLHAHWPPLGITSLRFGNACLPDHVKVARQALAIDEHRADYLPVLWTGAAPGADVCQMWFPGCHAQVGGGYEQDLLCEIPLFWMAAEAASVVRFRQHADEGDGHYAPRRMRLDGTEHLAPTIDAYRAFLLGLYRLFRPRSLRAIGVSGVGEAVHPSAWDKWANDPDYRPANLAHAGRAGLHSACDPDLPDAAGGA